MTETICQVTGCSRPSDEWIVCASCAAAFKDTLTELDEWLLDDLDLVITQQTRYAASTKSKSAIAPLVFNLKASDTKASMVNEMDTAARLIAETNGWARDYTTPHGAARWLKFNLTAIRLHEAGAQIVDSITSWYAACVWVSDRPAQRQYLGPCDASMNGQHCPGRIYGRTGKPEAKCDVCGETYVADQLRTRLLKELDDKLCTAAEIARLSTYLGLDIDREQVRKRINQWHKRGQITRKGGTEDEPKFRFADALALLARHDTNRQSA